MNHTPTRSPVGRLSAGGDLMVRLAAPVLVALNGLYMLLVAIDNITDYSNNLAFVQHVLAMDTTNFGSPAGVGLDPDVMWRSITDPWAQNAAYVGIIMWESAIAVVLTIATVLWVRGRQHRRIRAQQLSLAGLLMIIVLFAGGFICIGGEWFAMYRSTTWNGLDPAFRNTVFALLTLIVLCLPRSDLHAGSPSAPEND